MISVKKQIFNILKSVYGDNVSYGLSDGAKFPKIVYFLITSYHKRLSNSKAVKHFVYQINVYDYEPHDIERSDLLTSIEKSFEKTNLKTSEWSEIINVNDDGKTEFMYYIEVYS